MSLSNPRTQGDANRVLSGSLPKGLAILELLSGGDAPMGVTALARHMDMPKSGVHRLLQLMRALDWVRQTPAGEYECTLRLWELGQRVIHRVDLRGAAATVMRELAAQTRETALLSILDGTEVLYLDVVDSPQPVRAHTRPGDRAPAFCMATGKAMLANAPDDVIDAVAQTLQAFTPLTITTRAQLETELAQVRRKGFAINRGEWGNDVRGVAAPIFDNSAKVVAAISIGAPRQRMPEVVIRSTARLVMDAAKNISRELGYPIQVS